jgi:Arc/MetJ-type ribon-helix-helix transcriptional regulator
MTGDAIREALVALEEAWQGVEDRDYEIPDDARDEAKRLLDEAISGAKEAARIVLGDVS